jgi:formylglycine-generating enzyme required for sulfatase activity
MLFIPRADFSVTLPDVWSAAREPRQQRLHVEAFCIDRTEVPMATYHAEQCGKPARDCMLNAARGGPVVCVNLQQAECHCARATPNASKRLPTQAEWLLAALGTDGRRYPWGNDPYPIGYKIGQNFCPHQLHVAPRDLLCGVEQNALDASPFGVIGMAGNGSEMTSTCSPASPGVPALCVTHGADLDHGPLEVPGKVANDAGPFSTETDLSFRCATSKRAR